MCELHFDDFTYYMRLIYRVYYCWYCYRCFILVKL